MHHFLLYLSYLLLAVQVGAILLACRRRSCRLTLLAPSKAVEHGAYALMKPPAWRLLERVFAQRANQALTEPLIEAERVEHVPRVARCLRDDVVRAELIHANYARLGLTVRLCE